MNYDDSPASTEAATIMERIVQGMALEKCRSCGCMLAALTMAERAFFGSESAKVRNLVKAIEGYKAQMEPVAYDCLGCKVCWGAEATNLVDDIFGEIISESCDGACAEGAATRSVSLAKTPWPPCPGEYVVGDPSGTVAVCTLASHDLPVSLLALGEPGIAIAGKCDTENIGVEKVVLNILANFNIRWLVLCGNEAEGHRSGDAFLKLKEFGVDAAMRVQNFSSRRPILNNLTMPDVSRFRRQVDIVNLVGNADPTTVVAAVRECVARPPAPMADAAETPVLLPFERIEAHAPHRLELDPAGFFVILPNKASGVIVCEHYENSGRLAHVIEGKEAALIAATVVEQGMVTRLDHAAYLGRELAKAEDTLRTGAPYEQDSALGKLSTMPTCNDSKCSCH
jgi:tetrahydromethanopterin S-methyltransferase subunit A